MKPDRNKFSIEEPLSLSLDRSRDDFQPLSSTSERKMHGRPRKAYKPEEEAASASKAAKLRSLQTQFMSIHHHKIYTKEAIDLSRKLLEINPEAYTAWNYRKLAVEDTLSREESNQDLVKSILDEELKVVESALRQNFKSYGAWHHRKWVLSKGHSSVGNELRLLDKFQSLDSRNFHAWNYRRFAVELTNRSKQDELKYTEDIISKDFSNYSAWHNRSVLLSSLLARKAEGFTPNEKIPEEYKLVHDAIFTDEDDQSGWFYHLWLLDQTVNVETPLLTSSWPSHGSCINLSGGDGCLNDSSSSKLTTFCSDLGSFPLILYFDQPVSGVSSSTVAVDSELRGNEDLVWEPVSNKNSRVSCVWVARLNYMSSEPCFPKEYKVKVRIGNSPGIVSSRGCNFSTPYEFVFTAHVHDTVREDSQEVIVSWTDGFDIWDAQSKDLNFLVNLDQQMGLKWRQEAIEEEIELFRALSDSKIGKLTLARLLMAKAMISENGVKGVHYEEILELYSDLMVLDSSHYRYYKDEHSVALLHKVTSSTESLSRYLFQYRDINNSICLRLNNLSLSRIASVEKLLFVQMLDLSHNELHSTEGLEAMQLISCLNLSHNRIRSFSALDSLRHLKQLRVLDVSHNNIGEHSVDTTRYLCSSPLSNSEWTEDEVGRQMTSLVTKYWDAYFVLRDLDLKQLDIAGNVIAGDEFSSFVPQVVPKLVWLDGQKLRS
ncbi:geranylgeranyl transferase type-2 subunit alpha 1-like [Brassica napus]|uniref:geranylgeranyl transferase type-2 subunit alpha 1-like n=1 Tax=Brassica napus TaxID=3708 RepID=UPI0020789093|nr:geranylgeranyl transferase type-2 subunit alpha 1-like [Brassica napus]